MRLGAIQMSDNNTNLSEDLQRLDEMINQLSRTDIEIEDAFKIYSAGCELLNQCKKKVDKVEKEVLVLDDDLRLEKFE